MDGVGSLPNFYVVIPGIHSNGRDVPIYRVQNTRTREIVKQIPSEQEILRSEKMRDSVIRTLEKWV